MTYLVKFIRCDTNEILLETEIQPIEESNLHYEWDGPKTKYDYLFMNKE